MEENKPDPKDCPVCGVQPYYNVDKNRVLVCCMNEHCMIAGIDFWLEYWNDESGRKKRRREWVVSVLKK